MRRILWNGCWILVLVTAVAACSDDDSSDDEPGLLSFVAGTFTLNEDGTAVAAVTVRRTGGADGGASATITLTGGTATGGPPPLAPPVDYDNTPIVVTFGSGDTADKVVTVPILDDTVFEPNETVNLTLGTPVGAPIGGQTTAVLVIANNDNPGTLNFSAAAFTYNEDGTSTAQVTVQRTGGTSGPISVAVTSTDGSASSDPAGAVEPADYTAVNATVAFQDQDANDKIVVLTIVQDALPELDETFTVTLSNPTNNATIGAQASATVTIVDDDTMLVLNDPVGGTPEQFGTAVAGSGGRILVGVPELMIGGTPIGRIDVFDGANGAFISSIASIQAPTAFRFGAALSTSGPNEILVGAPGRNASDPAVVFIYNARTLALRLSVPGSVPAGNLFGTSVVALDSTFIVGSPAAATGGARIFDLGSGGLLQTVIGSSGSEFGSTLAALGNAVLVGSPGADQVISDSGEASLIDGVTGAVQLTIANPFPGAFDHFGEAVAVVGTLLYVGAPDNDGAGADEGAVYVFDPANGTLLNTITAPTSVAGGRFGAQLTQVRDRLVVQHENGGAGGFGEILVFDTSGVFLSTIANPTPQAGADFGAAMAEFDGALLAGAPLQDVGGQADVGIAYVFKIN